MIIEIVIKIKKKILVMLGYFDLLILEEVFVIVVGV